MGALENYIADNHDITPEMCMYVSSLELVSRVSPSVAGRIVRELRDQEYPGPRSNHGGNREKYYSVVEEGWTMYRINKRKVENIGDSVLHTIPDKDHDQESD